MFEPRSPTSPRPAKKAAPGASIDGVLVCETAPQGVECLVGAVRDELFGPVVTFGLGGVFVEVFDDIATRVPPFDRAEARRMIDQTAAPRCCGAPEARSVATSRAWWT